jgi:transposase-like protein
MGTTVNTELVTEGERRGRRGRRFTSVERRRELVAEFDESGLTRKEFARREGVRYTKLCNWVQREGKVGGQAKAPATVRFAEVTLPAGVPRGVEVRLPDGTTVRGERIEELVALVRALRA